MNKYSSYLMLCKNDKVELVELVGANALNNALDQAKIRQIEKIIYLSSEVGGVREKYELDHNGRIKSEVQHA